jgi:hypothetical protein
MEKFRIFAVGKVSEEAAKLIAAATMERSLCDVPSLVRERVRAAVFKSMILSTM